MAKAADGGFVSFYRSNDRLEAIYLLNKDANAYQQHYKAGSQDVYEFVATKTIEAAVEVYKKTPSKAVVSVVDFENLSASLTGEAKSKAAPAVAAAAPEAPADATKKRGPKAGKRTAKKAAKPAKKAAGKRGAGKRGPLTEEALADFAQMLKRNAPKAEIEKMLKTKHGLKYSPASYYNWKSRAEKA